MAEKVKRYKLKADLAAASLALPSGAAVVLSEESPEFELAVPDREKDPAGAAQVEADLRALDAWEHAEDVTPAEPKPKKGGE